MAKHFMTGGGLIDALAPALGVDATRVRRIVLDATYDDLTIAYVELVGTVDLLDVQWGKTEIEVRVLKGGD